jgi:hypothetical protein
MIHIVRANRKNFFVDAEDSAQAIRIMQYLPFDMTGAIADPYERDVPAGSIVYTKDDGRVPLLGGRYLLKIRDEAGWTVVAEVMNGPLWTRIFLDAKARYGEDKVSSEFVMND